MDTAADYNNLIFKDFCSMSAMVNNFHCMTLLFGTLFVKFQAEIYQHETKTEININLTCIYVHKLNARSYFLTLVDRK